MASLSISKFSEVSVSANEGLWFSYGLPEDVLCEPMPENYTTEDYLNTTNPYSDLASPQAALDEIYSEEGSHPLYVLVFIDEEEAEIIRNYPFLGPVDSGLWAALQLERGDEALTANFGIDIRILGWMEWDSNDSLNTMAQLWYELEKDTKQYLRQLWQGQWLAHVDAIIGITAQATPGDPAIGVSPRPVLLDQGRIFTLLKWQVHWQDDNLVQHEISHLYYAPDHYATCCAMANHPHYQTVIWEDGYWWVWADVGCGMTAYSWCTSCSQTLQQKSGRYPIRVLTVSSFSGGTTSPAPSTYAYSYGSYVTVTAIADSGYYFGYWTLDGVMVYNNPITVTMNSDHTLKAYFWLGGGEGCPMLLVWNGTEYFYEGLLNIHNSEGIDIVTNHTLVSTPQRVNGAYKLRLVEHPYTHSYIDQVKLYTVLKNGMVIQLLLVWAWHSEYGNVLLRLLFSDDWRTETVGANHNNGTSQSINLKFLALPPNIETTAFIFLIEGYNPELKP